MTTTIIYIDGEMVDMSPGFVLASTFQAADLGDLTRRKANFTNQLKLPKTPTNVRIFENCDNINVVTTKPYESLPCKVIQNGIETIPNGIAVLTKTDDFFNIVIYSGIFDLFDAIGDKYITELDFSSINSGGEWDKTIADGARNATTGLVSPVLQFGQNVTFVASNFTNTQEVSSKEFSLPCFYYHYILEKILSEAGYSFSGDIFTDPIYKKLIVTTGNKTNPSQYTDKFYNDRSFSAMAEGTQSIVNPTGPAGQIVEFNNIVSQGSKNYFDGSDYARPGTEEDNFMIKLSCQLDITVAGGTVDIGVCAVDYSGVLVQLTNKGTGFYQLNADMLPYNFPTLNVSVLVNSGTPTVTVNAGSLKGVAVNSYNTPTVGTADVKIRMYNEVLPYIKQTDFLKDFFVRFGLLNDESSSVLTCKNIDAVIADRANVVDLSSKRDTNSKEETTYTNSDIGQINYYRYSVTDEDNTDQFTGEGIFEVSNVQLNKTKEYTSVFSSSDQTSLSQIAAGPIGGSDDSVIANVPVWTQTSDINYDNDPGFRLLLVRDAQANDHSVVWDSVARTSYKVAYFDDRRFGSCSYQYFLDNYMPNYIALLQAGIKVVSRRYMLNEVDIASLSYLKPFYDNGSYFLNNKIDKFIPGKLTSVQLLKVS